MSQQGQYWRNFQGHCYWNMLSTNQRCLDSTYVVGWKLWYATSISITKGHYDLDFILNVASEVCSVNWTAWNLTRVESYLAFPQQWHRNKSQRMNPPGLLASLSLALRTKVLFVFTLLNGFALSTWPKLVINKANSGILWTFDYFTLDLLSGSCMYE